MQKVRAKISGEIGKYASEKEGIRDTATRSTVGGLEEQKQTSKEINLACNNLEKLLNELEIQTTLKNFDDKNDFDPLRIESEHAKNEIRRLRAFAADDTTMETTSVADYAADPEVPDVFAETPFNLETHEMITSVEKIQQSIDTLNNILSENPQWWNSAILVRRIKTHAVRANYHSRKTKLWGDHLRAHMLLTSSELNKTAQEGTEELQEIRKQMEHGSRKKAELEDKRAAERKENQELCREKDKLETERGILDAKLQALGEQMDVYHADSTRVELILLLRKLGATNREIFGECEVVLKWLTKNQVPV